MALTSLMDLVATLRLDTTQYESALGNADGKAGSLFKKFVNWKTMAVGAFSAVSAVAIKFGKDAVGAGMDFDKAISQVSATMGKTTEEFNAITVKTDDFQGSLRDLAIEMGSKTAFSATQAGEALNYMALAGYDAQKSAEMLPKVLNLAAAGNMDLAKASDMVTDASSALGLQTEETNALIDQMAKASSKSNTSVEQLGEAILRVGGTAKGLKGGTVELSTALGILADNGTKGAEGGTALRNVLLGIQGKKFEETFGELGISAYDAEGNMRSLKDVFLDMEKAMDGMTQQERDKIITNAFNRNDLKNINALLGTTADRWDELTQAIDDSAGSAQQMADTQLDNLAGDVTIFKSALEGAQIALSDRLSPALRDLVQFGTEGLGKLKEAIENPRVAIEMLGTWFSDMGGKIVDKMAQVAEEMPQVVASIVERITRFLAQHSGDIVEGGLKLLLNLAKGIIKALPTIIKSVGNILGAIINGLATAIKPVWNKGVEIMTNLGQAIKSKVGELKGKVVDFAKSIPTWIKNAITGLAGIGLNIVQGIWNGISGGLGWIKRQISGWVGNVKDFLKKLFGISSPSKWARDVIGGNIVKGLMLGIEDGETDVQNSFDSIMPSYDASDYSVPVEGRNAVSNGVSIVNYITVDGADDPEDFTDRFVRRLRMDMRMV